MALICLRCASATCTCGLLATVMASAPAAEVIEEAIEALANEALANPVMLSSGHIIAVADDRTPELETPFVLKPRDD
jgi:hypothetical protein